MCAKIRAGIDNLPGTGGTIDARGFRGTQACNSDPFEQVDKPVTLLLDAVNITINVRCKENPMGFGDCGLVVVFQHRPPNNTIPILHEDHSKWTGLFPRYS